MSRRGGWVVSVLIMTLLLILALRSLDWNEALTTLRQAHLGWFALGVLANLAVVPLSTWLWLLLLPRKTDVGFRTMFWVVSIMFTVSNGGPFMAGHAAGVHLLATRGGTGHATAASVKALEQLALGIAKLSLVVATLVLVPLPGRLQQAGLTLAFVVPVLGTILLLLAHRAPPLRERADGSGGWYRRVLTFLIEAAAQLEALRRPALFVGVVGLALGQKVVEGIAIYFVLAALDLPLPFWGVLVSLTAVNLSTMISVTPANVGIYEASAILAYRLAGVPVELAAGLAILQHLAYLIPVAGTGWLMLLLSGTRPGRAFGTLFGRDGHRGEERRPG